MARNSDAAVADATVTEGEAEAGASGGDKRSIVLLNGQKRADYIRERYTAGASRSDITKELNTPELNPTPDKKIPYQIVFQATKGLAGGPAPKTESSAAVSEGATG